MLCRGCFVSVVWLYTAIQRMTHVDDNDVDDNDVDDVIAVGELVTQHVHNQGNMIVDTTV